MAIEDLIANGIQPPQIITPFQLMAGQQELEQNKLLNIARKRALDEQIRKDSMREGLNRLYQQYGNDNQALIKAAAQQGYGEAIPQFVEQENARLKEARLQEKDGLESVINKGKYIASRLRSATPETWEQTVSEIEQDVGGKPIPRLRIPYDKNKVDALINEGLSNTQAVELECKKRYADLQDDKFSHEKYMDDKKLKLQEQTNITQQNWQQKNYDQRERAIDAKRTNKPSELDKTFQDKQQGVVMFNTILDDLELKYKELDAQGGITNPDKGVLSNIAAGINSSDAGQWLQNKTGAKDQSLRNSILSARPILSQAIMKATGMSSKQMDSNVELQNFMKSATDPQADIKSVLGQIQLLRKLYGNNGTQDTPQPQKPTMRGTSGGWDDTPEGWTDADEQAYQRAMGLR